VAEEPGAIRQVDLPVRRTARVALLGLEQSPETWLVLHGYGQLAGQFLAAFEPAARPGRLIVAPEALSRYYTSRAPTKVGASWMTRETRETEILDYLSYLDDVVERFVPSGGRLQVHGFSQGTATATRWAAHTTRLIDRLVLWGGGLAPEVDLAGLREREPEMEWHVCVGQSDPLISQDEVDAEMARLAAAGVPYKLHHFDGGHQVDRAVLTALDTDRPA
jgi:predicted esterase